MIKGSAAHDALYVPLNFEAFPRVHKLLDGIRARAEFRGIIANPKPYHLYFQRSMDNTTDQKVQLFLPCPNEE